jgi:hypothetical protein
LTSSVPDLLPLLARHNVEVRVCAAEALGRIGIPAKQAVGPEGDLRQFVQRSHIQTYANVEKLRKIIEEDAKAGQAGRRFDGTALGRDLSLDGGGASRARAAVESSGIRPVSHHSLGGGTSRSIPGVIGWPDRQTEERP